MVGSKIQIFNIFNCEALIKLYVLANSKQIFVDFVIHAVANAVYV